MRDASELARLYEEWFDVACAAAREVVQSRMDAEDAAERVFMRLCRARSLPSIKRPRRFFRRAGRNEALSMMRHRQIFPWTFAHTPVAAATIKSSAPKPDERLQRSERRALAARLVSQLPPRCRATCSLVFLDGLTHREAAERLSITRKAVEKQVARGRRILRNLIASAARRDVSTGGVKALVRLHKCKHRPNQFERTSVAVSYTYCSLPNWRFF